MRGVMMENQNTEDTNQVDIINDQIKETLKEIETITEQKIEIKDPEELNAFERRIQKTTDRLAGLITAKKIQQVLNSLELKQQQNDLIRNFPRRMKNQGLREVEITTLRGDPVKVKTAYYSGKKKKRRLKKKKTVKKGFYPGLFLLGIHDRLTPASASEISLLAVVLSSFQEARQILMMRGLDINVKRIREIANRYAQRADIVKRCEGMEISETVEGVGVVISTDGGRVRIREKKRGPRTKK
jgi:hypothetical protein